MSEDAARFDLKFPGGKVKEFVAAVSKALGKPVNVIIPKESEATLIPAVEVSRVTVSALFRALSRASQHQVLVPTQIPGLPAPSGRPGGYSYQTAGFVFSTEEKEPSTDAVWTFQVQTPPELPVGEPVAPTWVVQYFPIADYLSHFTVEDITTALESGWKLQAPTGGPAAIRFHEETKLLIIAGTEAQMKLIPQVLEGLQKRLSFPRTENLPITRKAGKIVLPALKFQEALVTEAVDFIRRKTVELDPDHKGINIVIDASEGVRERKVNLTLTDIPALEVLQLLVDLCGMELEIRDHAIVLRERQPRTTPAFTPAPADAFPLPGFALPHPQPSPPTILSPHALPGGPTN